MNRHDSTGSAGARILRAATGRRRKPFASPGTWACDDRSIAVLARAYPGASADALRNEKGEFVAPTEVST